MERAVTIDADPSYVKVAELSELAPGESRIVFVGHRRYALFNVEGEIYCTQNTCPHAGGFLGMGPCKGEWVRCPRHAWAFNVRTGECKSDPRYTIKRYPVRIEDGAIWIDPESPERD
jgi:nitrite reductase/ring-hydroxylating ferredoxin subunit